jgi:hypothetical protein
MYRLHVLCRRIFFWTFSALHGVMSEVFAYTASIPGKDPAVCVGPRACLDGVKKMEMTWPSRGLNPG